MRRGVRGAVLGLVALVLAGSLLSPRYGVVAAPALGDDGDTVIIQYQGMLTDADGRPVTGTVDARFGLYNSRTGGSCLWGPVEFTLAVDGGHLSVELPVPRGLLDGRDLWLGIYVEEEPLYPRQPIRAVPLAAALVAGATVQMEGAGDALAAVNTGSGGALRGASARGDGVYGYSESGAAVRGVDGGVDGGEGYAGHFVSNTGTGVYGESAAESNVANPLAAGVEGRSLYGYGVYGRGDAPHRAGVYGESTDGVALQGYSTNGYGLWVGTDFGIGAQVESAEGVGLAVEVAGSEATDHAISASAIMGSGLRASSAQGQAIRGDAGETAGFARPSARTGVVGYGVEGGVLGGSDLAVGVEGRSQSNSGVYGHSMSGHGGHFVSVDGNALYAATSGMGYDAVFDGSVGVSIAGNLWVGGSIMAQDKNGYVTDIAMNGGEEPLRPGDLVEVMGSADPARGDIPVPVVRRCQEAGSHRVIGVVDRAYDVATQLPGGVDESGVAPGGYLMVVTHGAYAGVRADTSAGAIAPGDLLVAAALPGHVVRSDAPSPGTVVGKALESLAEGQGLLDVMVMMQ